MLAAVLGRSHVPVFAFPLIKIITRRQLCQQLVRPVARMCFCFFACKNSNVGAAILGAGMLAAVLGRLYIPIFAFPLVKIITCGQLCQQLVRPIARICFRFFAHKNYNAEVAILVKGMPAAI